VHQLFIATSLQLLLPVIQTIFFSVPRFSIRRIKNPQKLNVIFLDQNRRNFTPQKLPVIRYFCVSIRRIVIIRSKNIFSSLESFQTLQLLNTHFFTVFAIYFVDRKYEVNSWIDIGINFDIFRMYIFNVILPVYF
jgi:hypothetical protein